MNRRGFFATLFAPLVAKLGLSKGGQVKPAEPTTCTNPPTFPGLTLTALNEAYNVCCFGKEAPSAILVADDVWDRVYEMYPPYQRDWINPDGRYHKSGYRTQAFNAAELVKYPDCLPGEVWMCNFNRPCDPRYNLHMRFRAEYGRAHEDKSA